jgi:hypothetical protein
MFIAYICKKSKNMISKIKYEYLLGIIAVLWVLFFSFVLQLKPYFYQLGDDATYLEASKLLYFKGLLDNTRPFLIAALFGIPYLFGFNDDIVIQWGFILNFCSWFFTVILIFKILSTQINRGLAFSGAIVFIFCIGNLAHAFRFLSESGFIFLFTFSIYLLSKYEINKNINYIISAIFVVFINVLVKPVAIGFFVIILLFYYKRIKELFFAKYASILAVGILLLFFQMYSMKKNFGDYTLSYISSITYYNYLGAKAYCYQKDTIYLPGENQRTHDFIKLSSHEMKKVAEKDFSYQLKNNTLNLFKAYLFCIYSNSSKGNYIVSECKNKNETRYFDFFRFAFKSISKMQTIGFTIVGVLLSFYFLVTYKKQRAFFVLISILLLYIFFISAISCYECDRFHIAFYPIVILLFFERFKTNILK